jgi:HSP20 family molecular chaperone IbpA
MNDLKKIISQIILLQKELFNSPEREQIKQFTLRQLADMAETFMDSSPNMEVHTCKDDVIVSGVIPNIIKPQDISVILDSGILLRIECRTHKCNSAGNLNLKPKEFKKKIELPYPVNPETLSATYQKGVLHIFAKRAAEANPRVAKVHFID